MTREELVRVTQWKMRRGVWRARNLALVRANPAEQVEETARQAFAQVPDLSRPINALAALGGVGPATASALLAAAFPADYPFLDDPVAAQIPGLGPVAYTARYYRDYAMRLRERAATLQAACAHAAWPVHDLDLALWAVA